MGKKPSKPKLDKIEPSYLKTQRWFQNKGALIAGIELVDRINFGGEVSLGFFKISFSKIPPELYCIAYIESAGTYYDATDTEYFWRSFFKSLIQENTVTSPQARLVSTTVGDWKINFDRAGFEIVDLGSSNTMVLVKEDDRPKYILKFLRRLRRGKNVEAKLNTFLYRETDFANSPTIRSTAGYFTGGKEEYHVATLFDYVENEGSGWSWTVDWLTAYVENCVKKGSLPCEQDSSISMRDYLDRVFELGRTLGLLHLALSSGDGTSGFESLRVEPADAAQWSSALREQCGRSYAAVGAALEEIGGTSEIERFKSQRGAIEEFVGESKGIFEQLGWKIRQHADFHLGQVLVVGGSFQIIDFEGEPLKPYSEREIHYPALKDAAGMLRSFDYATFAVHSNFKEKGYDEETLKGTYKIYDVWKAEARRVFIEGYYNTLKNAGAGFLPLSNQETLNKVLTLLMLEKALYEVEYEINNRPAWVSIPLGGISMILEDYQ